MPETLAPAPFDLAGRYGGFVFTDAGKRRMLLRTGERECLLKVPRQLRYRIIGKFRPGDPIRVAGFGERDLATGAVKHVVARVLPPDAPAADLPAVLPPPPVAAACPALTAASPILVCTKKNCWRNGGRELWDALGREVCARELAGRVELRQVGCLGRCKHAPNVDHGRHEHSRCAPGHAAFIVSRAAQN